MVDPRLAVLWEYLERFAPGRANAIPRARILARLRENVPAFRDLTDRGFRLLADQLCAEGWPAFACERGYYAGLDADDLAHYRRYLAAKAMALHRRGRAARWALEAQRRRRAGESVPVQMLNYECPSEGCGAQWGGTAEDNICPACGAIA